MYKSGWSDAFVSQQFLNSPDVVALLDQMGCKGVPQGVAADFFMNAGLACGRGYGPLHRPVVDMVAPADSRAGIGGDGCRGKHILPGPRNACSRVFARQGRGEIDAFEAGLTVLPENSFGFLQMGFQSRFDGSGSMVSRSLPPLPSRTVIRL